jgi:hypothetical protein
MQKIPSNNYYLFSKISSNIYNNVLFPIFRLIYNFGNTNNDSNTSPSKFQNLSREWICILLIVFIIEEGKDDQAAEKAARAHFE